MADSTALEPTRSLSRTAVQQRLHDTEVARRDVEQRQEQFRRLFDNSEQHDEAEATFDAVRIARVELAKVCEEMASSIQASQQSRFWRRSARAEQKVNHRLQSAMNECAAADRILSVDEVVGNVEEAWKASHGKVYKNFQRICTSLHAHERIFSIFPSETLYTSVLSGALSCVVQASVNHSSIAAMLSQSVADISDKVASCAAYLEVTPTLSMKKRMAEIYSQLFRFYRDVLKWYMSSPASKLLGSLDASIKAKFEDSVQAIADQISQMGSEGGIAALAIMRSIQLEQNEQKADIKLLLELMTAQQRLAHQGNVNINVGVKVLERLTSVCTATATQGRQRLASQVEEPATIAKVQDDASIHEDASITESETDKLVQRLQACIVGDDGLKLLARSAHPKNGHTIAHELRSMLIEIKKSRILWISGPYSVPLNCSMQTMAVAFVAAAREAGLHFLSHFCDRPRQVGAGLDMTPEQCGVLGLVYSLLRQLLRLGDSQQKQIDDSDPRYSRFVSESDSWQGALDVLRDVLAVASNIRFCIIYGLNAIESGNGAPLLRSVLDLLLQHQHQRQTAQPFHILLITSGQSRLLGKIIRPSDRHIAQDDGYDSV